MFELEFLEFERLTSDQRDFWQRGSAARTNLLGSCRQQTLPL
jgi:hypothetical protein